ncbi:hypothetical protein [Frankia nepalensis]|uniref:hypothetical protein n=1 Tax=Frankia nepalensis TaxID=1836974 RepID=UPI001EE4D33A|nr:hypothetical protein [Frankia nepalensis]
MATPTDPSTAPAPIPPAAAAAAPSTPDSAGPSGPEDRSRRGVPRRRAGRWARRHALFGALAAVALSARALVVLAYQPALMYFGDSGAYLDQAWHGLWPGDWRPSGYPMFLRLIRGEEHLTRLVLVQHSLTFLVGVATYAVALRVVRRPWVASLCAAPVLLSPWVLDLGQFVLAETLFGALTALGLLLVALPGRPRAWAGALAGLLLGASLTIRTVGYGPLAVGFVVLVATAVATTARSRGGDGGGARATSRVVAVTLAYGVAAAAPVCAYSGWSLSEGKGFSVSAHSGYFLYGRVAPFVDCSVIPDSRPDLLTLCDPRPVSERTQPDTYLWPADSLLRQGHPRIPKGREQLAEQFADEVIRAQPWMVVSTAGDYLVGYFSPTRHETSKTSRADTWELPNTITNVLPDDDPRSADGYFITTSLDEDLAGLLHGYSKTSYAPMPLVAAGLVAGILAVPVARARRRPGPPPMFWLTGAGGLSVLALSALTAGFDYRYLASVIGVLGVAAVLGAASLARALRPARAAAVVSPAAVSPTIASVEAGAAGMDAGADGAVPASAVPEPAASRPADLPDPADLPGDSGADALAGAEIAEGQPSGARR